MEKLRVEEVREKMKFFNEVATIETAEFEVLVHSFEEEIAGVAVWLELEQVVVGGVGVAADMSGDVGDECGWGYR